MKQKKTIKKEEETTCNICFEECFINEIDASIIQEEWNKCKDTNLAIVEWFIKVKLEMLPTFRISISSCNRNNAVRAINKLISYGESLEMIVSVLYYSAYCNEFWNRNLISVSQLIHSNSGKAMKYEYIKSNLEEYIKRNRR